MEHDGQRIFLVSNRLPMTAATASDGSLRFRRSAGGLVTALNPLHKLAKTWWVGYAGDLSSKDSQKIRAQLADEKFIPVGLTRKLYNEYYNGLANGAVWPLFHYLPSFAEFSADAWKAYTEVNEKFCEVILQHAREGDFVWVHDFHLMLLPTLLRKANRKLQIGYFHHIPFPASEVFRILPWRKHILEGLLGADVVGFHTLEYARHFINAISRHLGHEIRGDEVHCDTRTVKVGAFPLGIDTESFIEATRTEQHAAKVRELSNAIQNKILVLGVDRLDYTKGIKERLLAFAHFLKANPDLAEKVVLLQLSVPSRIDVERYGDLRSEIERLVGKINGEFGTLGHTPVQYLFKSLDKNDLTALYKRADVCLITPLRDGLNLVCKEYITLKDDLNGMLILSEFVGASEEMGEALLVNPYDVPATAEAIATAIRMPAEEKRARMKAMRTRVFSFDNESWSKAFFEAVHEAVEINTRNASRDVDENELGALENRIAQAKKALLCIDYDALAQGDQRNTDGTERKTRILNVLKKLEQNAKIELVVLTSQSKTNAEVTFSDHRAWIFSENGAFVRASETQEWQSRNNNDAFESIKHEIMTVLGRCVRRVPNSVVEVKESYILWNYRRNRSAFAHSLALETAHALNDILSRSLYHCVLARNGLEIRHSEINKGSAVKVICQNMGYNPETDVLITVGDNKSDEEMFQAFGESNISISIGSPGIFSRFKVADPNTFLSMLETLAVRLEQRFFFEHTHEVSSEYVPSWNHRKLPNLSSSQSERLS